MKTIIMDSANKYLVVALYEDEKCLASFLVLPNLSNSERLLLAVLSAHRTPVAMYLPSPASSFST